METKKKIEEKIELGDTVEDIYSGFKGVATSKTEFINGCVQFGVVPKVSKENLQPEEVGIDESSLKIIKKNPKNKTKIEVIDDDDEPVGGAYRNAPRMRGY